MLPSLVWENPYLVLWAERGLRMPQNEGKPRRSTKASAWPLSFLCSHSAWAFSGDPAGQSLTLPSPYPQPQLKHAVSPLFSFPFFSFLFCSFSPPPPSTHRLTSMSLYLSQSFQTYLGFKSWLRSHAVKWSLTTWVLINFFHFQVFILHSWYSVCYLIIHYLK